MVLSSQNAQFSWNNELTCGTNARSSTMSNALSGFAKCRIWPCNRHLFTDDDFVMSDQFVPPGNVTTVELQSAAKDLTPAACNSIDFETNDLWPSTNPINSTTSDLTTATNDIHQTTTAITGIRSATRETQPAVIGDTTTINTCPN